MFKRISESPRFKLWRQVIRPWWLVMLALYALINLIGILRSELITVANQDSWRILKIIPAWPWYWWTIAFLLLTILALLEGFYHAHAKAIDVKDANVLVLANELNAKQQELVTYKEQAERKLIEAQKPRFNESQVRLLRGIYGRLSVGDRLLLRPIILVGTSTKSSGGFGAGQDPLERIAKNTGLIIRHPTGHYEINPQSQPILQMLLDEDDELKPH